MTTQRTESETRFFDEFVASHGDYDVLGDGAYRRLVSVFEQRVRPRPGERCVDLGCGTGAFTRRLRHFGLQLQGMDISPAAVAHASKQATSERYVCGDITSTELPDGSFDIVLYSGVLHHFPTRDDRVRVLREGFRLLAPGGRLFAFDPNQHSPSMWLYRDPRSPLYSDAGKTDNEVLLTRAGLEHELQSVGFSEVGVFGVSGITFSYIESKAARLILPLYNVYEQVVRYSPLEKRLGTFLISVARKA
ncbi:MAG TPA: class I SAM-dependent methyltransferase [Polyangiales bacterium]|nr:class I SAM-dependent methyltransferase [Polyangiales bacterium]